MHAEETKTKFHIRLFMVWWQRCEDTERQRERTSDRWAIDTVATVVRFCHSKFIGAPSFKHVRPQRKMLNCLWPSAVKLWLMIHSHINFEHICVMRAMTFWLNDKSRFSLSPRYRYDWECCFFQLLTCEAYANAPNRKCSKSKFKRKTNGCWLFHYHIVTQPKQTLTVLETIHLHSIAAGVSIYV